MNTLEARFNLGRVVATAGSAAWFSESPARLDAVALCVGRHARADWGDVCPEDGALNDAALDPGNPARILSAYTVDGRKVWIITEWDRSSTTILFPEEY